MPIAGIRLRIGDRLFPGVYGDARPDVARMFHGEPGSERPGYEIPVVLPFASSFCELEVQLSNGFWTAVQIVRLRTPRTGVWFGSRRWTAIWSKVNDGRPDAWHDMSEPERDYAVAWTRVQGWHNLHVEPHHAPRSLSPELFPAPSVPTGDLPKLTVVTASLQQRTFLEQTMRSVLDQQGVRLEYVVQDGGSTDGSLEVIGRYSSRLSHWESAADGGQASAIVRGFSQTAGQPDDVMMFLNSDDLLMEGAARFVAEFFARHPEVDAVYGHRVIIDGRGQEIGRWFTPRLSCLGLSWHNFIPQETLFWRRRIWDHVGGINRSFQFALDWDLLLRFEAAGARFARLPWFLGSFRVHPDQKTQTRLRSDGVREMTALRERTLGRQATRDELHAAMRCAEFDSALVCAAWQEGQRV